MDNNQFFQINEPFIVEESIDDEVIVINLETGSYYSLTDTAAFIWNNLKSKSAEQLISKVKTSYENLPEDYADLVIGFVEQLKKEVLIKPSNQPKEEIEKKGGTEKTNFSAPILETFTDMKELLLLDPIHEVNEAGWPLVENKES